MLKAMPTAMRHDLDGVLLQYLDIPPERFHSALLV
jgi:hypothetical protein